MRRSPEPFGSSEGSSLDTSLISKSGDQTRRFHLAFEGGAVTALTIKRKLRLDRRRRGQPPWEKSTIVPARYFFAVRHATK
jgi:hypothetical protein